MKKLFSVFVSFLIVLSIIFCMFSIGYVGYVFCTNQVYFSNVYADTCEAIQQTLISQNESTSNKNLSVKESLKDDENKKNMDFIEEQIEHLTRLQELEENTMTIDLLVFLYGFLCSIFVGIGAFYVKKIQEEHEKTKKVYIGAKNKFELSVKTLEDTKEELKKAEDKIKNTEKVVKETETNILKANEELKQQTSVLEVSKEELQKAEDIMKNSEKVVKETETNILNANEELKQQTLVLEDSRETLQKAVLVCENKQKEIEYLHGEIFDTHNKFLYFDVLQTAILALTICFQCEKLKCETEVEKNFLSNLLPRFNDTMKFLIKSAERVEKNNMDSKEADILKFVLNEIPKSIDRCRQINKIYFSDKYVKKINKEVDTCIKAMYETTK